MNEEDTQKVKLQMLNIKKVVQFKIAFPKRILLLGHVQNQCFEEQSYLGLEL